MIDLKTTKEKIKKLAEKYGLSLVVLFGSQVTGQTHSESDFDVAYMSERKLSFDEEVLLNTDLTEVFRNDHVQLVNLKTASPLLMKQVVVSCIVLYEKSESLFNEFYIYALRMYGEAKILFDLREHYLEHIIKAYKHVG